MKKQERAERMQAIHSKNAKRSARNRILLRLQEIFRGEDVATMGFPTLPVMSPEGLRRLLLQDSGLAPAEKFGEGKREGHLVMVTVGDLMKRAFLKEHEVYTLIGRSEHDDNEEVLGRDIAERLKTLLPPEPKGFLKRLATGLTRTQLQS